MKALIFDSGTLINLSMNGLLYILEELKKSFDGKFLITEPVKYETIDRPIDIPRFELGALRIRQLLNSKVLEMPSSLEISTQTIKDKTASLLKIANTCLKTKETSIQLVSEAEISCLALSEELTNKGISNLIAIDERTTRILTEKPKNLEKLMSKKLHTKVTLHSDLSTFKNFRFIRSTEIVYVAYKKGILHLNDPKALEAVLYATKFKGSSVSYEEIDELKKL